MLSCGICNLIAVDIEASIDTERAQWFFYRQISNAAHALWEDGYTRTKYRCRSLLRSMQTYSCSLLRNLLASFVRFHFFNILSQERKRFTPDMLCVPSLEEKVLDESINQTTEQGCQCKTQKIELPLQSKFNSKCSLTLRMQQCQIHYKDTKDTFVVTLYFCATLASLESCFVCFCCPWMRYWFSRGFLLLQHAYNIKSRKHYILKALSKHKLKSPGP